MNVRESTSLLTFISLVLVCGGCTHPLGHSVKAEAWLTQFAVQEFADWGEESIIGQDRVFEVPLTPRMAAARLLEQHAFKELAPSEAARFLGQPLPMLADEKPFVVRGVSQNEEAGAFQCFLNNGILVVSYGAMGREPKAMHRQPVIVWLKQRPERVIVACSAMQ